jgi:hypothetical protein
LYCHPSIDYSYVQSESNEQIKNDMVDFDKQLELFNKAEQERKEAEYQEYLKQEEIRNAEYNARMEEEKKQIEVINNNVTVNELNEDKQYFVIGSEFAHLNKNNTLDEYKEEVLKGEYELNNVKITKEIHFTTQEALNNFSNMLLTDFDFLEGTGGSYTDDNRVNTMTDYYNMDEEEQNTVTWNLYGVAIYFNNKLQFVVDAQGYNYARYVGLTDNAIIQKVLFTEQTINNEELTTLKNNADTLEDISTSVIEELNILSTWNSDNWNEYKSTMKDKLNQNTKVIHKTWGKGRIIEDIAWDEVIVEFENETDYGFIVTISKDLLTIYQLHKIQI